MLIQRRWYLVFGLVFLLAAGLVGCNGGSSSSDEPSSESEDPQVRSEADIFNEWKSRNAVWPAWASEQEPAGFGQAPHIALLANGYINARVSYDNTVKAIREFRYILNHVPDLEEKQLATLILGMLLETVREDLLAYQHIDAVLQSGETEAVVTIPGSRPFTVEFAEVSAGPLLGIYARNKFPEKMAAAISEMDGDDHHLPGDHLSEIARAYYMAGMNDKALERLAIVGDETKFSYPNKMSSTTLGAVSLAYRMGEYDKVAELSEWMITEGFNSTRFTTEYKPDMGYDLGYLEDQWQSPYKQIEEWRSLAQKAKASGKSVDFTNLSNGDYTVTTQGYRDEIDFTVTVADGKLSATAIDDHAEDRAYTAFVVLPEKWQQQKNMMVDGVTGATVTSGAVEMALIKTLQEAGGDE